MQKFMTGALISLFISPVWASALPVQGLLPSTDNAKSMPSGKVHDATLSDIDIVKAGGFGGNPNTGLLSYTGDAGGLPALTVSRGISGNCYLENYNAHITYHSTGDTIKFFCPSRDPAHNYLYWSANFGSVNGAYSPENDALYATDVITSLFTNWYGIPPVVDHKGRHDPIHIQLHANQDNATLNDDDEIIVGDGGSRFYPLTSLSILSYMVGLIFTVQNSNLSWQYSGEDSAIRIAFGCMTAMAAEFYVSGKNTWQVGADVTKDKQPLYYMDQPSKDCNGNKPGNFCSVDMLSQYKASDQSAYYGSGLFNRAFYLLATSKGWDTHKAYDAFVHANRFHWKRNTDFHQAACDVVGAASELGSDIKSVIVAFSAVGIDTRDC